MTQGLIYGKSVLIYFQTGTGFVLYGCASELSVQVNTELISVKTIGDGAWAKKAPQSLGYTVNINGIAKFDDNVDAWYILANQTQFIELAFRFVFTSNNAKVKRLEGIVLVESTALNATPSDLVKANFTLQGSGPLNQYDNNGICAATIISANMTAGPSTSRTLTFTASSDTAYIAYEIRRRFQTAIVNAGTVYAPGFTGTATGIIGTTPNHDLIAIPYCANGVAGPTYTAII